MALAVIAVVALFVATEVATGAKVKTTVEITSGAGDHFEGVVNSASSKCVKNREVSLVNDTLGETVGTDKSDASGAWSIDGAFIAGDYHAEVAKRTVGQKAKKKTKCKGARSPSKRY